MSLATKIVTVSHNVTCFESHFPPARARRPALAPFESGAQVAAALDVSSPLSPADRYAIVAALVAEHQDSASPLWAAILVLAFAPMLLRLRKRLRWPEDEDRDQNVLVAFLVAIGDVRPDDFATVALQRATWKALMAERVAEAEEPELVSFDESVHTPTAPDGMTAAEIRAEAAWAVRREQRHEATRRRARAAVRRLPTKRVRGAPKSAA